MPRWLRQLNLPGPGAEPRSERSRVRPAGSESIEGSADARAAMASQPLGPRGPAALSPVSGCCKSMRRGPGWRQMRRLRFRPVRFRIIPFFSSARRESTLAVSNALLDRLGGGGRQISVKQAAGLGLKSGQKRAQSFHAGRSQLLRVAGAQLGRQLVDGALENGHH